MSKNSGKTECLNCILRGAAAGGRTLGVTSIGVDGESRDIVSNTKKPEISLSEGTLFVTSETHYARRRLISDILDVSRRMTSLGRLVTARVVIPGKVMLSGPPDTAGMREVMGRMHECGAETVLVDGALSRLSLSSPTVADALVLATGAAVAPGIQQIVAKTRYVYEMTCLDAVDSRLAEELKGVDTGVWGIDSDGMAHDLGIRSSLMLGTGNIDLFRYGTTVYVAGAVSDRLLEYLRSHKRTGETVLIMKDFTRMFATKENYYAFIRKGGRVMVANKNRLLAMTVNPFSPQGYNVDAEELRSRLLEFVDVPVYDVMKDDACR